MVGNTTRVKVVKNKLWPPPFKRGRVRHHVRRGRLQDGRKSSTLGVKAGIVEKSGAWFYL